MMRSLETMRIARILLIAALAIEGWLILKPEGALVRAARRGHDTASGLGVFWWRNSPFHLGCSVPACTRPATRIASYRQWAARGAVWRAYGFCDLHEPPADSAGLVYRPGTPSSFQYDIPLTPVWTEIYFLLGVCGFAVWCAGMWRYSSKAGQGWLLLASVHLFILTALWNYTN